jgi:hypothetical protein
MVTNRILYVINGILAFVVVPAQVITTLIFGIAVSLTFGLLLLPLSLIWMVLYFPMLGLSWVCNRIPALRDAVGIIFLPWVIVADVFVCLIPSMGELESRAAKMMLCDSWPFTWEFSQFLSRKLDLESACPDSIALSEVVNRIAAGDPLMQRVVMRVTTRQQLDSNEVA